VTEPGSPSDHITPYDRLALDERVMISLLAAPAPNEGLVEYFGADLHAELARLARLTIERPAGPDARRVYVLPGIMGSQLGIARGGGKPNDILWLDPIDFQLGRLSDLKFGPHSRVIALGAMNYTYLKLTLSLRAAGFDAVLLDYDWRRDVATLGKQLAGRIAADGRDDVALVAHSMGGLVARGALIHAVGRRVSSVVMLGTPNSGSFGAVQALRGTYSVVRKLAQLDLRHDAEYLAREVFSSFPGLHELLPSGPVLDAPDLFDSAVWPTDSQGPDRSLLRAAKALGERIAPGDARFHVVVGCNHPTATGIASGSAGFEYEYSRRGDGTVPMALARLAGAAHGYIDCDHSDLPLDDRVIAGTIGLLGAGATQQFSAEPPAINGAVARVRDAELRELHQGKVDWPHMAPAERRRFLDTLNEPPQSALGLR
jgi:pimeloyl-ACP methyl ester carboxylesterase